MAIASYKQHAPLTHDVFQLGSRDVSVVVLVEDLLMSTGHCATQVMSSP
jgi:hypothetical protein